MGCVDGADAAELVEVVGRGERVCAAMKSLLATRVAETGAWRADGSHSAGHWLAERTGVTVGAAQQALQAARTMEDLPEIEAAFRAGELSETQAGEIASAALEDPAAEAKLLEAARTTSMKGLRDECRQVRAGAQADDRVSAEELVRTRRAHEWYETDGAYRLDGRMPPDAARGSRPPGTPRSIASSRRLAGPDGASLGPPTRPTRWWRWPPRGRPRPLRPR